MQLRSNVLNLVALAATLFLTTFTSASAQNAPSTSAQDDRQRDLKYYDELQKSMPFDRELEASLDRLPENSDIVYYQELSSLQMRTRAQLVRALYPRNSDAPIREYPEDANPYVGAKGRFTDEQIAAIRLLADSRLILSISSLADEEYGVFPIKSLSDNELADICKAFGLDREQLDQKLSEICRSRENADGSLAQNRLFEDIQAVPTLTETEALTALEGIEGDDAGVKRCEYVEKLPPADRALTFKAILQLKPELLEENERAYALQEFAKYYATQAYYAPQTVTLEEIDETIKKTLDAAPDSWKLALAGVVALSRLPKNYYVDESGVARRARFRDLPEACSVLKRQGVEIEPSAERRLYGYAQDRAYALQVFDRTAQAASDALRAPNGSSSNAFFSAKQNSVKVFFNVYAQALCKMFYSQGITSLKQSEEMLEKKTDFHAMQSELSEDKSKYDTVSCYPVASDLLYTFPIELKVEPDPVSFLSVEKSYSDLESDRERLVWVLNKRALATPGVLGPEEWQYLAAQGAAAQELFGVYHALNCSEMYLIVIPPNRSAPPSSSTLATLKAIPELADDETIVANVTQTKPTRDPKTGQLSRPEVNYQYQRVKLVAGSNFIERYTRSLELHPSYETLSALAYEYQNRGHYKKAREYWSRAKDLATTDDYFGLAERARRNIESDVETSLEHIRKLRLQEIENYEKSLARYGDEADPAPSARFLVDRSYAYGMRAQLCVKSEQECELEFTARRLDLAPELAKTRTRQFTSEHPKPTAYVPPAATFADLVQTSAYNGQCRFFDEEPTRWTESFTGSPSDGLCKTIALPLTKPGAYLIETSVDGVKCEGADSSVVVFLRDRIFAWDRVGFNEQGRLEFGGVTLFDEAGKPDGEREVECFQIPGSFETANVQLVATDAQGRLSGDVLHPGGLTLAVVQPSDSTLADVAISVVDARNVVAVADLEPTLVCSETARRGEELTLRAEFPERSLGTPVKAYLALFDPTQPSPRKELGAIAEELGLPTSSVLLDATHAKTVLGASKATPVDRNVVRDVFSVYGDFYNRYLLKLIPQEKGGNRNETWKHAINSILEEGALPYPEKFKSFYPQDAQIVTTRPDPAKTFVEFKFQAPQDPGAYKIAFLIVRMCRDNDNVLFYAEKDITVEE